MSCVFCKIVNGELPCFKVYEDSYTLVFMDHARDVDGHMIAIPKMHCKNLLDCDAETLKHLMEAVKKVSLHCVEQCGYDGVNLLNASGESAGQSAPHFHIHIIPRKSQDQIDAWPVFRGAEHEISKKKKKIRMI